MLCRVACRLFWGEALVKAQTHHVLEHRSSGRQIVGVKELRIKEIVTRGSAVDRVAAFEDAGCILRVVHADQRASVVHRCSFSGVASVFQIAEEVVHSAVCSEILQVRQQRPIPARGRECSYRQRWPCDSSWCFRDGYRPGWEFTKLSRSVHPVLIVGVVGVEAGWRAA